MFDRIKVHGYFMEYDSERAGSFEPLRAMRKGQTVVLGLVRQRRGSSNPGMRCDGASTRQARYADLDQLCLSPQCGFASTEEGNSLAEEQQWAKLRMVVDVAGK